jgi:ribose transport system substrate-binding protein
MRVSRVDRGSRSRRLPAAVVAAGVCLLLMLVAACSSSGASSSTSSSTSSGTSSSASSSASDGSSSEAQGAVPAAVTAQLAQYENPPTGIGATQTVTKKVPKEKVGFVVCSDPSCATFATFWKAITAVLGWSLVTVNVQGEDVNSAVQELVQSGVNYIGETGYSVSAFRGAMANAKAAHIPVFECFGEDAPEGPANNVYSNCFNTPTYVLQGQLLADYAIKNSGGKANVLTLNLPAYPVLTTLADTVATELKAECPGCTYGNLNTTPDDLAAGNVPDEVISYLQDHPSVDYVMSTYSPMVTGLTQALKSAGLSTKVQVIGSQPVATQITDIADGTLGPWLNLPREYSLWDEADQMVQLAAGQWSEKNAEATAFAPMYFLTSANAKSAEGYSNGWPGPAGFRQAYEKAWGVS